MMAFPPLSTAPARTAAYHALRAIVSDRADLPAALVQSREHLSDERDRALAAEIVTGTLRWQRALDHLIGHFARRPLSALDAEVVTILRLSLYQLLHLDRVPASAVVDDAVNLTRAVRKTSATGFVNAVLRNTLRQRPKLPLPARPERVNQREAAVAYLGITHSHPDWLVTRWLRRYGFDASEQWVRFNNDTPRLTLRVNTLRTTREAVIAALDADDVQAEPSRHAPHGLIVTSGNPLRAPLDGSFFVQDEASQLVSLAVHAQPGERVLDLCASPGGKTTAMAADMEGRGSIVACDVRPRRMALLREMVRLSGAVHVQCLEIDAAGPLPFTEQFDRVLVDAPCSGLGTIRRDPDIRWRRQESDLATLARAQTALLARVADQVAPGGRLVYATCSSEPEENDGVVEAFLARHSDYALVDLRRDGAAALQPFIDARGMMRTVPFEHGLEAFFAAALQRRA
jgi:16S rRNA (cytosine967-C5)-methyltransferase